MKRFAGSLALGFLCLAPMFVQADSLNLLGTANGFAVLGASAVTNTGASVLGGNLGVAPGSSATGFAQGAVVTGVNHGDDGVAVQAHEDASAGYGGAGGAAVYGELDGAGSRQPPADAGSVLLRVFGSADRGADTGLRRSE